MTETVIQMEKTTGELMDILRSKPDAAAFVQENADELQNKTVPELLADLLERKQLTRAAVIRAAGLARTYGYQLFDGTYTPTQDKLIQLAFGFQLTVEETQALLKAAGHAVLYPRKTPSQTLCKPPTRCRIEEVITMARRKRTPEENARREKIRELLQLANVGSMDDIQ